MSKQAMSQCSIIASHNLVRLGLVRLRVAARGIHRSRVGENKLVGLGIDRHVKAQVLLELDCARGRVVLGRRGGEDDSESERGKESESHVFER